MVSLFEILLKATPLPGLLLDLHTSPLFTVWLIVFERVCLPLR